MLKAEASESKRQKLEQAWMESMKRQQGDRPSPRPRRGEEVTVKKRGQAAGDRKRAVADERDGDASSSVGTAGKLSGS